MFRSKLLFAIPALLLAAACGGSEPPPKSPDTEPVATAAPTDIPPPAATAATETTPPADTTPVAPAVQKIDIAAMKFTPSKKWAKAKSFEIKGDGTVASADGKTLLKIDGDHIEDASGRTLVTVGADGALMGDFKNSLKFSGDDIVGDNEKISIGDDGTATMTHGKKSEAFGKFDSATGSKKTAALVVLALRTHHEAARPPAAKAAGHHADKKVAPKK
ncbi:MAG: hypothetical protein FWD69_00720 [Polyangiaceae bacterium]|nr:hypothetical protein [Polyangiaceae bacterium]